MRFIRDILADARRAARPTISVEFFPTRTDEGERTLLQETIPALCGLAPDFCSVTYGAGGSTRAKTLATVDRIQREHRLPAMAHLTCVNATRAETEAILAHARELGVRNILALRGDPPDGAAFTLTPGGFEYSYQLVQFVRAAGDFSIGVAGFPEGHIACAEGRHVDWNRLRHKIEQGADFVVTQLFFKNSDYFAFRDHLQGAGVTVPIIPGILPVLSASQIKRFVTLCGADLPAVVVSRLEACCDDEEVIRFGIEYATLQCEELLREGAPALHFYSLNRARSTTDILRNLGLARELTVAHQTPFDACSGRPERSRGTRTES
jgi:methylenetetrahydrofolate reductase (NADPH)